MEQDPTLRLKALRRLTFKTCFFDRLYRMPLYQLDSALIGTEKWNGISRVSAPFSQIGLIGTEIKGA